MAQSDSASIWGITDTIPMSFRSEVHQYIALVLDNHKKPQIKSIYQSISGRGSEIIMGFYEGNPKVRWYDERGKTIKDENVLKVFYKFPDEWDKER